MVLRLIQNGSCSHHAQLQSMIELQGHPVESFEAFSKLSLRLHRGPDAVPQAKAGKASTSATNDTPKEKGSASVHAGTTSLYSSQSMASPFKHVENADSDMRMLGWLQHMKGFIKHQFKRNNMKARMQGAGVGVSSAQAVLQSVQHSNAPHVLYPNSTHGRQLLAGSSCCYLLLVGW